MPDSRIILLADDDAEDQELLEEALLERDPFAKVDKVFTGQQAVEYLDHCLDNGLPCLIVLDYKIPLLNGVEVLQWTLRNPRYEKIPKIVWSSSSRPEHVKTCLHYGAVAYFVKPTNVTQLGAMALEMLATCNGK